MFAKPITRMILGLLLFLSSFGVIFWNEILAEPSVALAPNEINATEDADPELDGEFVTVTGTIESEEEAATFYLQPLDYLVVKSSFEEYTEEGWKEMGSELAVVGDARIGNYTLELKLMDLAGFEPLRLSEDLLLEPAEGLAVGTIDGDYLYYGEGSNESPVLLDQRTNFKVIPKGIEATVVGELNGTSIEPHSSEATGTVYKMTLWSDEEIETDTDLVSWGFRGGAFLLMWIGLMVLFSPLLKKLDVVPMFASKGKKLFYILTFLGSLILSLLVILLSNLIGNIWILGGIVVFVIILIVAPKLKGNGPVKKIKI